MMLWTLVLSSLLHYAIGFELRIDRNPSSPAVFAPGQSAVLTCRIESGADVKGWIHDNTILTDDAGDYVTSQTLMLPSIGVFDGTYMCVQEKNGVLTYSEPLEIKADSIVLTGNHGTSVYSGPQSLSMTCTVTDHLGNAGTITWYVNGNILPLASPYVTTDPDSCGSTKISYYKRTDLKNTDSSTIRCSGVQLGTNRVSSQSETVSNIYRFISTTGAIIDAATSDPVILTCTVNGDKATAITWTDEDGTSAAALELSSSSYPFSNFRQENTLIVPIAIYSSTTTFRCSVSYTTGTLPAASDATISKKTVTGISDTTLTTLTLPRDDATLTITCQFTATDANQVKFYKDSGSLETTNTYSTVTDAEHAVPIAPESSGDYYCSVTYTGYTGGEIIGKQKKVLNFRGKKADPSVAHGTDGSTVTMSCEFTGDSVGAPTWKLNSNVLTSATAGYNVDQGAYANYKRVTTLQIDTAIVGADGGDYTCEASYISPSNTYSETISLTVYKIVRFETDNEIVEEGDPVTITCEATAPPTGAKLTISIHMNLDDAAVSQLESTDSSSATISHVYSIAAATYQNNGVYLCTASYDSVVTGDPARSEPLNQYVRAIVMPPLVSTVYGREGEEMKLNCFAYGDDVFPDGTWTRLNSDGSPDTTLGGTNDGRYSADTVRRERSLAYVPSSWDGTWRCSTDSTFTLGLPNTELVAEQKTARTGISSLVSNKEVGYPGDEIKLTCTYNTFTGEGLKLTWSKDGGEIEREVVMIDETENSSILTLRSVTIGDMGVYRCTVQFGIFFTDHLDFVLALATATLVPQPKLYKSVGDDATLTCLFTGVEVTNPKWITPSKDEVLPSTEESVADSPYYQLKITLDIMDLSAREVGEYHCTGTAGSGASAVELDAHGSIVLVDKPSLSFNIASGDLKLTCTFSTVPEPQLVTFKNEDDPQFSVVVDKGASASGTVVHTSSSITRSNYGRYSCAVRYSTTQSTSDVRYVAVVETVTDTPVYGIMGAAAFTISCTYYGGSVAVTSWFRGSDALEASSDKYEMIEGQSYGFRRTDTLTIKNLDSDDASSYSCKSLYLGSNMEAEATTTLQVSDTIYTVSLTRDPRGDYLVNAGDSAIDLTCLYAYDPSRAPTVTWHNGDGSEISGAGAVTITSTNQGSISARITANIQGKVTCRVTYPDYGAIEASSTLTMRSAAVTADKSDVYPGESTSLTCTVRGDEPRSVEWFANGVSVGSFTNLEPGTDGATLSYYTLDVVANNPSAISMKCAATYDDDTEVSSADTAITKIGSTVLMTPEVAITTNYGNKDSQIPVVCSFTQSSMADPSTVAIKDMQGQTVASLPISSSSDSSASLNVNLNFVGKTTLKLVVTYPTATVKESIPFVLYSRAVDIVHPLEQISSFGGEVTLTCVFHGDAIAFGAWTYGDTALADVDAGDFEVTTGSYNEESSSLTSTLKIQTANQYAAKAFICSGTYTAGSGEVTKEQTIAPKSIGITSNSGYLVTAPTAFRLLCSYTRDGVAGVPTVRWLRNGHHITGEVEGYVVNSCGWSDDKTCLIVSNSGIEGKQTLYKYTCEATYDDGVMGSTDYVMKVRDVIATPATVYGKTGTPATLTCVVHGSPDTEVTSWSLPDETEISENTEGYQLSGSYVMDNQRFASLTIVDVAFSKAGVYSCNTPFKSASVQLHSTAAIDDQPGNVNAEAGDEVIMTCSTIQTYSEVTIKWFHGDTEVPANRISTEKLKYSMDHHGSNNCDYADQDDIADPVACQAAAGELNYGYSGTINDVNLPSECISRDGESTLSWNTNTQHFGIGTASRVCRYRGHAYSSRVRIDVDDTMAVSNIRCQTSVEHYPSATETSDDGILNRLGFVGKGQVTGYAGNYIESNTGLTSVTADNPLSESYQVEFRVVVGSGISSASLKFTDRSSSEETVVPTASDLGDGIKLYTYSPPYNMRKSGVFAMTVVYGTEPEISKETMLDVSVYEFCNVRELLPAIPNSEPVPEVALPFLDPLTIRCLPGYTPVGVTTSQCGYGGKFVHPITLENANCVATADMAKCAPLPGIVGGVARYSLDGSTASYVCNDSGHTLFSLEANEYECNSETGVWSLYSSGNPTGILPYCSGGKPAREMSATVTQAFPSTFTYCSGPNIAAEELNVKEAVEDSLNEVIECIMAGSCQLDDFQCSWDGTNNKIITKLHLNFETGDAGVMKRTVAALESSSLPIQLDNPNTRRRAVETLTGDGATIVSNTDCGASAFLSDGVCVTCPPGYGYVSLGGEERCEACPVGYYSETDNLAVCNQCPLSTTTSSVGSTSSAHCITPADLCRVPPATPATRLLPVPGSDVPYGHVITVGCEEGYALEAGSPTTFRCSDEAVAPICYRKCDLSEYTKSALESLNYDYESSSLAMSFMRHDDVWQLTCKSGYESETKTMHATVRCVGNRDLQASTLKITSCTDIPPNAALIVGIVLGLLCIFLILVVIWCALKRNQKQQDNRSGIRAEQSASTKL